MTIWQLIKANRDKKREQKVVAAQMANPLDGNLPFGIHVDGKIEINALLPEQGMSARFIQGAHIVEGFSEFMLMGYCCFRVLIRPEEGGGDSYLLILKKGSEILVRWFVGLDDVYPSSKDEWNFWLSKKDGSIGLQQFQLKEGTLFNRLWGSSEEMFVEPIRFQEKVILDRYDSSDCKVVEQCSMLYGRKVEDEICPCEEYVFLSACTERDGSYVSIDVGVDLVINANIKVIY